jgi:hypothetical protein
MIARRGPATPVAPARDPRPARRDATRTGDSIVLSRAIQSRSGRRLVPVAYALAALLMTCSAAGGAAPPGSLPGDRRPGEPLARVDEMVRWIEGQSMPGGGWHAEPRFGLDRGLRLDWFLETIPDADAATTAMVGVTLLRTRDARGRSPYHGTLVRAVRYVQAAVDASPSATLDLDGRNTPIGARVGSYVDTALALLLLAEASPARTPTDPGPTGPRIEKLIRKLEVNQEPQGCWGRGSAANAPLLGHALAVWALEAASRKGHKVDPGVLALAGRWALGKEAQRVESAAAGKWRTRGRGLVPDWLERHGTEDDEPINYEMYAAAARLSVLAQADRSNRRLETQLLLAARTAGDAGRRTEAARSLQAIETTRASLAEAQRAVAETLTAERGAAPFMFAAEDFIACLLIVDSLPAATAGQWFPPTVKTVVAWQDADGGLKTDKPATCKAFGKVGSAVGGCKCEEYLSKQIGSTGTPMKKLQELARQGQATGRSNEPSLERPFCPDNLSFCSKDRVFCTAVAVATILADTPYKAGMFKGVAEAKKE